MLGNSYDISNTLLYLKLRLSELVSDMAGVTYYTKKIKKIGRRRKN